MSERKYRVLFSESKAGLIALAGTEWTLLESTVREFKSLDTDDDHQLGNIGQVVVDRRGFVALAWK
jgi:hypothetical protein